MSPLTLQLAGALLATLGANQPVEPTVPVTPMEWVEPEGLLNSLAMVPAPLFAFADDDDEGSPFSYTFLELKLLDGQSDNEDNYQANGSFALGMYQIVGSYTDLNADVGGTDACLWTLGVGMHYNMTPKLDLEGDVSWLYNDTSSGNPAIDESGSGWAARFGPRWMPINWNRGGLELHCDLRYADLNAGFGDTDGVGGYGLGVRMHFSGLMSVGAFHTMMEDDDDVGINIRFSF